MATNTKCEESGRFAAVWIETDRDANRQTDEQNCSRLW